MFFYRRNKRKEKEAWHLWFAWHPVQVSFTPDGDGKFLFLETVRRCGIFNCNMEGVYWEYQYKPLRSE